MARLVVVLPLTPLRHGDSFVVQDWPLHVTVLPPFDTDAAPTEIAAAIASAASEYTALTVAAGHGELFGRHRDVPVTVVVENEALTRLHKTLIDTIRPFATSPQERAFIGTRFRPHVTTKRHARLREGDRFSLTQIALVDMAPRASPDGRSVLATVTLPASST